MDSVHNVLLYIYLSVIPIVVFCFNTCAKKKPNQRNSTPRQSAISQPSSSGAPFSQPVPNASTDPIKKSKEKDTKTLGVASADGQPPSPPPVPTGSEVKQERTDPNKEARKETKEEKPKQKEIKKGSKESAKDASMPQKETTPSTPTATTPAPATAPATPAAAPPTPAPAPNPSPNEANQLRGMEIHKSMKIRNKKKDKSKNQAVPRKSPTLPTDGPKLKNTKKCELKQATDEEDDDDDDDETLRNVTSLKLNPNIPPSVDEPTP